MRIIGFAIWMAGLGTTVAGDHYPFNLMLLAVGGIMQWLAMIAILVAQNAQGNVQDKQVQHLHQLGVTTHELVIENTELTEAIHDHLIKKGAAWPDPLGLRGRDRGRRGVRALMPRAAGACWPRYTTIRSARACGQPASSSPRTESSSM